MVSTQAKYIQKEKPRQSKKTYIRLVNVDEVTYTCDAKTLTKVPHIKTLALKGLCSQVSVTFGAEPPLGQGRLV
jgi:hypothetical protein